MKPRKAGRGYGCLCFVEGPKPSHLCRVKHCRRRKAKNRRVCHKHHVYSWRANNPMKAAYATLRDHAKRRKIKFSLTMEEFRELVMESNYLANKGNHKHNLHIDRIDPLKGYEWGNLQVITCSANSSKGAGADKRAKAASKTEEQDDNCPF